ncbi:PREDICTED: 39S ribosomal protein L22, mitochondrial-like isoform X2 [Priapulus caudatus]|uniref:Large ribosomal subunit protein uL22m n=1 Tax=Priapulus caudatus TaxID=37621 RepID=A0ABM1EH26_PRICU|nr:PREDICTED: 39S ribosomal protein L22, mitochondrial-like isoform X2 [Priapulus caudatus]
MRLFPCFRRLLTSSRTFSTVIPATASVQQTWKHQRSCTFRDSILACSAAFLQHQQRCTLHTSAVLEWKKAGMNPGPTKWPKYNQVVWEPQKPDEPRRPAEIFHHRANIKYSPKKLWYIASWIRGMSIDEAIKQLSFHPQVGSHTVKEILLEAQDLAVKNHGVEYKSNLWIAESLAGRSSYIKGLRRHGRARYGMVEYKYCHYMVKLQEGSPPEHYYPPPPNHWQMMEEYLANWRRRTVLNGLKS